MFRFLIEHVGIVVLMLLVTRRAIRIRQNIPTRIKLRHYVFLSFLVFMNVSGISHAIWTLRRLLDGDFMALMGQYFITLNELPPIVAVVIWVYCVVGRCMTTVLAFRVARSSDYHRAVLLRFYPLIVLADGITNCIIVRGAAGIDNVESRAIEYAIAFFGWCLFAWPYFFVYRFYRDTSSDILFSDAAIIRDVED
jgi:tellurite resistance protein TehA-like permease